MKDLWLNIQIYYWTFYLKFKWTIRMTLILTFISMLAIIGVDRYQPSSQELVKYVESFEKIYNVKVNYSVKFIKRTEKIDIKPNYVIGYCIVIGSGKISFPVKIDIYEDTWKKLNISKRILLIFHELGHCSLGLYHVDVLDEEGCPINIMTSLMPSNYCIQKYGIIHYIMTLKQDI